MNKKNVLLVCICMVLFCSFSFFASAQKPKTALELNDQLASITDSLYIKGQTWGSQFNGAVASKNYKSLAPYRLRIQDFIDRQLVRVKAMPDINGSQPLRQAMIDFLHFEQTMITTGFMPLEKMPSTATDQDIQKAIDNLTAASKDETAQLQKLKDAQDAYGKKNGFSIAPDPDKDAQK